MAVSEVTVVLDQGAGGDGGVDRRAAARSNQVLAAQEPRRYVAEDDVASCDLAEPP